MVKNIFIGQKSFVTKSILKYLKNPIVFSANELTKKKIQEQTHNYKKINLVFKIFTHQNYLMILIIIIIMTCAIYLYQKYHYYLKQYQVVK